MGSPMGPQWPLGTTSRGYREQLLTTGTGQYYVLPMRSMAAYLNDVLARPVVVRCNRLAATEATIHCDHRLPQLPG